MVNCVPIPMPPQIWDLICLQLSRLGRHTPVAITRSHGQERSGPNGRAKDLTACPLNSSVDVEVFRSLLDGRAWFKLKEHFCLETMAYNHCQTWLLRFWGSMKVLPWYPESWTMPKKPDAHSEIVVGICIRDKLLKLLLYTYDHG